MKGQQASQPQIAHQDQAAQSVQLALLQVNALQDHAVVISSTSLHLAPIHLLLQHLTQLQMELLQHSFRIKIVTTLTLPVYFSHGEHAFQAQTEHISIQQPKLEPS